MATERTYEIGEYTYSAEEFRALTRGEQIEAMVEWFHSHFEDPAVRLPYESREGGYQWIYGGPYSADDQIQNEFSEVADFETMQAAVDQVTGDGLFDWAPRSSDDDYDDSDREDGADYLLDQNGDFITDQDGNRIIISNATEQPDFREELVSRLDRLENILKEYVGTLPPRNHNNPPELVEPEPITAEQLDQISEVANALRQETAKEVPDAAVLQTQSNVLQKIGAAIAGAARLIAGGIVQGAAWEGVVWLHEHPKQVYDAVMAVADVASQWAHHLLNLF